MAYPGDAIAKGSAYYGHTCTKLCLLYFKGDKYRYIWVKYGENSKKESQGSDFTTQWHEHCFKIDDFHIHVLSESFLGSLYTICMNKGCKIGCV